MGLILSSCTAVRYQLPLRYALHWGAPPLVSRCGFIMRLGDSERHYGYGEVAPFPGLHKENLQDVWRQWRGLQSVLTGSELPADLQSLEGGFENWLEQYALYPALRCGLEMAALNLLAAVAQTTLAGLLRPCYPRRLPVNALVVDSAAIPVEIEHLLAAGYATVKLKVGRQALQRNIDSVRSARAALGTGGALRLDANRCWDLATAVRFGTAVADCGIEYIEEPLADPAQLARFYALTGVPVALDETLAAADPEVVEIPAGVAALVLKPMVLGGFETTARLIRLARRHGLKSVLSSVFESGIGVAALANVAAALCGDTPAGLDTYRWLREDVLAVPLVLQQGRIDVDDACSRARRLRAGWSTAGKNNL